MRRHQALIPVASALAAPRAQAECITGGQWWIGTGVRELVFSGRVVEISRTAESGYRASLEVDRVEGRVPLVDSIRTCGARARSTTSKSGAPATSSAPGD